jgi:hypothetical protein
MSTKFQQNIENMPTAPRLRYSKKWSSVVRSTILIVLAVAGVAAAFGQNPAYDLRAKRKTLTVEILALSTTSHVPTSNQEVYLANLNAKGSTYQLVKLVDTYASAGSPILRSVLVDHHLLRMTLVRAPDCDSTGQDFFLSPGDANIFDASTRSSLQELTNAAIPCFTVVHTDTRLKK